MNRLAQWLEKSKIKRGVFAEQIGVAPSYVTLLCSDSPVWPGRDVAIRIREATGGEVTADDFLPKQNKSSVAAPVPTTQSTAYQGSHRKRVRA